MNSDPAKRAWQSSVEIGGVLPLEDVRKGADKFYRLVRMRNLIEYVACAIVVVCFGAYVVVLPHLLQKIGSATIVLAAIFVAWQLHSRASAEAPEKTGTQPILEFMRQQLIRQRDALRSVLWWYLLPFVPGLVMIALGSAAAKQGLTVGLTPLRWPEVAFVAGVTALFAGIYWLNQHFVRKLQQGIDEIDALMGGQG